MGFELFGFKLSQKDLGSAQESVVKQLNEEKQPQQESVKTGTERKNGRFRMMRVPVPGTNRDVNLPFVGAIGTGVLVASGVVGGGGHANVSTEGMLIEPTTVSSHQNISHEIKVENSNISPQEKNSKEKLKNAQIEEVMQILAKDNEIRENAGKSIPLIIDSFTKYGIATDENIAFAIVNAGVEARYDVAKREHEGVDQAKDNNYQGGDIYYGRGLIQLTHKDNYIRYGKMLGLDLENNPELALKPENSAAIMALYFKDKDRKGQNGISIIELISQGKITEARREIAGNADTAYNRQIERLIEIEYPRFLTALRSASYKQSISNRLDYNATQTPRR